MLRSTEGRFILLFIVLFSTMPFGISTLTNALLIFVLFNAIIGLKAQQWTVGFRSRVFQISAVFYLFLTLSLLWSEDTSHGLMQLETKFTFLLAPLVLIASVNQKVVSNKALILKSFLAGNILVSITAIGIAAYNSVKAGATYFLGANGTSHISFFTYEQFTEPFMHPGYFSTFLGMAILICIYFIYQNRGITKWIYGGILAFLFVILILVQGRINVLALLAVISGGVFILAVKKKAYLWLSIPVIPIVILGLLLAFGSNKIDSRYLQLPDFSYDISGDNFNSATYRLAEWTCASDVIAEHRLLGTGVGSNNPALMKAYENRQFWAGLEHGFNAHNQYIETTIASGYVGLSLLLLLLFYYGKTALFNNDYLTLSCLAFFAISMLTESMLERANAVLLFTSFFPLMLGISTFQYSKKNSLINN